MTPTGSLEQLQDAIARDAAAIAVRVARLEAIHQKATARAERSSTAVPADRQAPLHVHMESP